MEQKLLAKIESRCFLSMTAMVESIQYVTNEQGERIGVLLDWNTYARISQQLGLDKDCLVSLSVDELRAIASCRLALTEQTRLDDLVAKNSELLLGDDEIAELDDLLAKADQLTLLKTRARYTLKCLEVDTTAA